MSLLIKYLLTSKYKTHLKQDQVRGFTMVELLVAMIMSFLIITPILTFAVGILNDDVKEQAKASTELELQSAMDYIQQDISQAYYIYDGAGVTTLTAQIPAIGTPVLVFWKRESVKNAIDVTTQAACASPSTDDTSATPICDDSYVDSLVAYYLVKDNLAKWCQPGANNCPARIERWSIRDGVKNSSGVYICGTSGQDTTKCPDSDDRKYFRRDAGFSPYNYDADTTNAVTYPLSWAKAANENYVANTQQVLVNYVDAQVIPRTATTTFCLNTLGINPTASPTPTEINYRIGTSDYQTTRLNFTGFSGCVDTSKNIAQITIRGDAVRRNEARNVYCPSVSPSPSGQTTVQPNYCPIVTGQIGGKSGFGQ